MGAREFETALARLYVEPEFRRRFLESPEAALRDHDLTPEEAIALTRIDRVGLIMAARSYHAKRAKRSGHSRWKRPGFLTWLRKAFAAWRPQR